MTVDPVDPHHSSDTSVRRLRAGLGTELRAAREARGLDLAHVARELLFSTRQVEGLESGQHSAFHNEAFYLRAAEAYAAWLAVLDPIHVESPPVAALPERERSGIRRVLVVPFVAGGCGLGVLVVGIWLLAGRHEVRQPALETAAAATPESSGDSGQATPAGGSSAANPASGDAEPVLLEAGERAWLFVRYADGDTVERWLEAGSPFDLGVDPVYLAVGTERVLLRRGSRVRRLDPWAVGSQVRVNKDGLAILLTELAP